MIPFKLGKGQILVNYTIDSGLSDLDLDSKPQECMKAQLYVPIV